MSKKNNSFRKEVEKGIIDIDKSKQWLATKMGMSRELFTSKMNNRANYKPFNELEIAKIRKLLANG
jgi:hypothetical protein